MNKKTKLGATGKYPEAPVGPHDDGELRYGIANDGKLVHLNFGVPVDWIGLPPAQARELGMALLKHAGKIDNVITTVTIDDGKTDA